MTMDDIPDENDELTICVTDGNNTSSPSVYCDMLTKNRSMRRDFFFSIIESVSGKDLVLS